MRKYPGVKELAKLSRPGRYAVGHGAFLQISQWNTRAWIFRYVRNGKAHHLGLGSAEYVTLAEARQRAYEMRRAMVLNGIDPLEAKRAAKHERALATVRSKTFKQCALDYITAHEGGWRGDRSRRQWFDSLTKHVFPKIGEMAVADIDVAAVLSVLDPIAKTIPETAARVRNRIALILDWAAARDLRPQENPAKRPNLLPKRKKRVRHFAAMPYAQVPALIVELRRRREIAAQALEFAILTASRPNEVLGARWSEIEGDVWTVPPERMQKSGKAHRVPLSARAVELLAGLPRESEFIFPGSRVGSKLHDMAMNVLLRRMGHADVTAHGTARSSFRDWAAETTGYPNHVVEMALAHAIANGVEAAYRRGDLFEKRRRLMHDWADYCNRPIIEGDVVPIRKEVPA
jgi:integrase